MKMFIKTVIFSLDFVSTFSLIDLKQWAAAPLISLWLGVCAC